MRSLLIVLLGLVGGFVGGIVISEALALSALALFGGHPVLSVLRFLPFVLAIIGAAFAYSTAQKRSKRSQL